MIYAVSITCAETKTKPLSEDTIYTVEFISDVPIDWTTIQPHTLIPIMGMPNIYNSDYIFAQTVTLQVHRPVQVHKYYDGFPMEERIPGIHEERITVTGPLVKNKVEALARGYFGRIDDKNKVK